MADPADRRADQAADADDTAHCETDSALEHVFVAAHPIRAHPKVGLEQRDVAIELCALQTGDSASMAFTSIEELVNALGPMQPWIALSLRQLRNVLGLAGVTHVAVDPVVPADAQRWSTDDMKRLIGMGQ